MDILTILEWCVLGLATFIALMGFYWIRRQVYSGDGPTYGTICSNLCYLVAVVVIWFTDYSPFHLLWLFPASFVMGFLTLAPAFSLILVPLAKLYGFVATIGLDSEEVEANKARVERVRELIAGGMEKEEAVKLVLSEKDGS